MLVLSYDDDDDDIVLYTKTMTEMNEHKRTLAKVSKRKLNKKRSVGQSVRISFAREWISFSAITKSTHCSMVYAMNSYFSYINR